MNVKDWIWFCKCLCDMGIPVKLGRLRESGKQMVSRLCLDRMTCCQVRHMCEQWVICGPSRKLVTHQRSRTYLILIFIILGMWY